MLTLTLTHTAGRSAGPVGPHRQRHGGGRARERNRRGACDGGGATHSREMNELYGR